MTFEQLWFPGAADGMPAVDPDAAIAWDSTKPEGTPRKLLDVSRPSTWAGRTALGR